MSERVAIVGSRWGASEQDCRNFLTSLYAKHPDTIIVSGGADGIDKIAETHWMGLGGKVESYRPVSRKFEKQPDGKAHVTEWGIEKWTLGVEEPRVQQLLDHPTFADYASACLYRDTLISESSDRIVSFQGPGGSWGAGFTTEWGEESQPKPRYTFFPSTVAPCE